MMDAFKFKNDLFMKKCVLSIATVLFVYYVLFIIIEDGVMSAGVNYFFYDPKVQEEIEQIKKQDQADLDRYLNGMRSVVAGIKKGADSMNKDFDRMQKEFEEDKKKIAAWNENFALSWKEQDKTAATAFKETDARWKKEEKARLEAWDKADERRENKRIQKLIALFEPSLECEKRIFGKSSLDPKKPEFYNQRGIENTFEICKDLRRKK